MFPPVKVYTQVNNCNLVKMPEKGFNGLPPPPPPPPMLSGSQPVCINLTSENNNKTQLLSDIRTGVKLKQSKPMENGILSVNGNVSCFYSSFKFDLLLIFILFKF